MPRMKGTCGFILIILPLVIYGLLLCPPTIALADESCESTLISADEPAIWFADLEAQVITSKGRFVISFLPELAPLHVMNFIALAESGFYDGITFHRYVEGFVVQGGDPTATGTSGPGYGVPAEIYDLPLHVKGAVGMARTSDEVNPERVSSGSQFYICLDDVHRLDNKYTVFGNVVRGMDIVMELREGDTIEKIRVRKATRHFEQAVAEEIERLSKIDLETDMPYENLKALVNTNKGEFTMQFFHDTAPKHVENFIKLSRDGFYDGLTWHRYVQGFVIQGGDPDGTGTGGPGYTVPAEISPKHNHVKGAVGMARTGDDANPERASSGSQFYICLEAASHLNGGYTVWAEVTSGMENVLLLREGDTIDSIEILPVE